jgi:hypothetical protein
MHILETSGFKKRFFKDSCASIGLGFIADVQAMEHPGTVAKYVTKYMAKSISVTDWPAGFHRFRFSRQWPLRQPMDTPEVAWSVFLSIPAFHDELRHWQRQRFSIVNTRAVNIQTGEINDG